MIGKFHLIPALFSRITVGQGKKKSPAIKTQSMKGIPMTAGPLLRYSLFQRMARVSLIFLLGLSACQRAQPQQRDSVDDAGTLAARPEPARTPVQQVETTKAFKLAQLRAVYEGSDIYVKACYPHTLPVTPDITLTCAFSRRGGSPGEHDTYATCTATECEKALRINMVKARCEAARQTGLTGATLEQLCDPRY